jgi:hypothetical protein
VKFEPPDRTLKKRSRKVNILFSLDAGCLGHVVARDVTNEICAHELGLPPISIAVVDNLQAENMTILNAKVMTLNVMGTSMSQIEVMRQTVYLELLAFAEGQIFLCACIVIIKGNKYIWAVRNSRWGRWWGEWLLSRLLNSCMGRCLSRMYEEKRMRRVDRSKSLRRKKTGWQADLKRASVGAGSLVRARWGSGWLCLLAGFRGRHHRRLFLVLLGLTFAATHHCS